MDFLLVLERIHEKKEAVLGEEFMETLEKSATEIMTRKMTSQEGREMVTKYCQYIPPLDQSYFEQCTDQFLAFALNFADKSIYHMFKSQYNSNFSSIREDPRSPSDLSLYIIRRLLAISNKKWVLLFVQSRMEQTKTVEKKFVLLEMLALLSLEVETKEAFFPQLLPEVLRAVTDGIKKFESYRAKFKSEDMNESAKVFQQNFEGWVIDYLNRFLNSLKKLPEVKSNNTKKLLRISDLQEIDTATGQTTAKSAPSSILITHYIVLFYLDIFQGITEALHNQGVFDEHTVQSFLTNAKKLFNELIPSPSELVDNASSQLRYLTFTGTETPKQIIDYTPYIPYNLTGVAIYMKDLFNSPSFGIFYSTDYKLRVLLPFLYAYLKSEPTKADFIKDLIMLIPGLVGQADTLPGSLNNPNYFNVPASKLLVRILEPVGSSFDKETQQKFIPSIGSLLGLFDRDCQFEILSEMILGNENSSMAAFVFDILRKELSEGLKRNEHTSFTEYEAIQSLIQQLIEKETNKVVSLVDKTNILNSTLSTMEFILMRMKNALGKATTTTTESADAASTADAFDEGHLLNRANIQKFAGLAKELIQNVDKKLGDSFDEVTAEKQQIEKQEKLDEEEKKLNDTKNEQLSMLKFHTQSIADLLKEIEEQLQKKE